MEKREAQLLGYLHSKWVGAETRKWKWEAGERISWTKGGNEVNLGHVLEMSMEHTGSDSCWRLDIWF